MSEPSITNTELLTKMQVIKRYFPGCGYNTVNPVFYEDDFPKLIIPGKKRPLYPAPEVEKWIHNHTVYGF